MSNALPMLPTAGGSLRLLGVHPSYQEAMVRYAGSHIRLALIFPDFLARQLVALCQHYHLDVTYALREKRHP